MSRDAQRRSDEILGATVLLTGWTAGREDEVADALHGIVAGEIDLSAVELPMVVLVKASLERAEAVRARLTEAGGSVELEDAWVKRETPRPVDARPPCPHCGSTKTQPYTHAGPAARKTMKCTTCGRTFRLERGANSSS